MQPNFLVVGAAKAGTTWLYSCLEEHPEIFVPKSKELHFFSYPRLYEKGVEWYESFFSACTTEKTVGEVSTSYLPSSEAPARIHAYNPDVRLVFILRHPIKRAYSHYCMDMRIGKVSRDINSGLTLKCPYVAWGLYFQQITRFMNLFPQSQIKIFLFEDIKNNQAKLLHDLYSYLEVDSSIQPPSMLEPKNTKRSLPKFPALYNQLRKVSENIAANSKYGRDLITQLRFKGYFELFHQLNKGAQFPKLSQETEKRLAEYYYQDVLALSKLLGRDLSHWISHSSLAETNAVKTSP